MKTKLHSLAILLLMFVMACQPDKGIKSDQIPFLLDRSSSIQMGKEWDHVQNYYVRQKLTLENDPSDVQALLNLAELFIKEARVTGEHGHYYPAALKMLDEMLDKKDISSVYKFQALTNKAGVLLSLHQFGYALQTAEKAIAINRLNAQIYGVLVDCHVELGNYDQAITMAETMIDIKPDIRSYSRISYLREIHGDPEGAMEAMKMAVAAGFPGYEESAWAELTLGNLYKSYGHIEKAKKCYLMALSNRPDYPFAEGALAKLYIDKGDFKLAEEYLTKAVNTIPEVSFYVDLAKIYKIQGRALEFEKIIPEIITMLKADTDSGHNMNLAFSRLYLDLLDDPDEAIKFARREYQKRPKNIEVNQLMAEIYIRKNLRDQARSFADVALSTDTKNPEFLKVVNQL